MKRRIVLWGFAGFVVAGCWALLGLAIPISSEPILWNLARLTCPIVPVGFFFHFGIKLYWVLLTNLLAYALVGLMVEGLRQTRYRVQVHGR